MTDRTTSPAGRAALEDREGVRLEAYRDSVGVLTIGVGHTGRTAPPAVHAGMTITRVQADEYLSADLAPVDKAVNQVTRGQGTQNQHDALVSLGFNIGYDKLLSSTVARKFASGDVEGAADAFLMWNKPPELVGRRRAERAQFLRPDDVSHPSLTHGLSQVTDVKSLQTVLTKVSDYSGAVDDDFGPATEKAVRKFQADHDLVVDGVVGEKTYEALDAELLKPAVAAVADVVVSKGPLAPLVKPLSAPAVTTVKSADSESLWDRIKSVFTRKV